jgi:hypothetical protein
VLLRVFICIIYIRVMSWQVTAGVAKPGQRRETRFIWLARCSDVSENIDWVTSSLRGSWVQIPPPASTFKLLISVGKRVHFQMDRIFISILVWTYCFILLDGYTGNYKD